MDFSLDSGTQAGVCGDTSDTRWAEEEGMQAKCLLVIQAVFEPRSAQTCLKPLDSLIPRSTGSH